MECPVCERPLSETDLSAQGLMRVASCAKCRGCWVDGAELKHAEDSLWANAEGLPVYCEAAVSEQGCPRCPVQLVTVSPLDHPELQVDKCPTCHGFWLDHGELAQLGEALADHAVSERHRPADWSALRWLVARLHAEWRRRTVESKAS